MTSNRRMNRPRDFGAGLGRTVPDLVLGTVVVDRGQGIAEVLSSRGDEGHISDMMVILLGRERLDRIVRNAVCCCWIVCLLACLFVCVMVCGC
jgi:hypothetical protein